MDIEKAVLHILDKDAGSLICSQKELDLSEPQMTEYIHKLAEKLAKEDKKTGDLAHDNQIMQLLQDDTFDFIEKSTEFAKMLFDIISSSEEIPGGDLLTFQGKMADGEAIIGLIKLNYKAQFTHYLSYEDDILVNQIILNKAILPSKTQSISEGVIIHLKTGKCQIIEKKYLVEGHKIFYFSEKFLKIAPEPSPKEHMKTVRKAIQKISDKYHTDEYISMAHTQQAVYESVEETGHVDVLQIAETVFEENISAKKDYLEIVQNAGIQTNIPVDPVKYEKKYSKQKFKLDNGIELTIPLEVYQNKDLVEFINHPDGTTSVTIKNIDKIINKFSI